ncbi:tRNA (uridine(34)/cytosine(34)/5-carboxymethylaminomethyluridine(34)-2'-O)-methyltransferase TrmL [Heliorestis acidaminivorans]|uniref:Putative tRNA (cytidine(34)-2'-O)-methyltransferase n=1 Tax=Heliorestis acidaminivorans TaxID=553427 RepID=A0A6I0EV26_9FIRM|nr:tRNA (uridine(34)/cytosine(34)/5-carboxymethylaminomethyluridine(34)-2'-O)-methyltransferase TrmL [Heliorestis acidaminivorans]KAB2953314.1 tRNA (uridine(34)/cytosine(34)/5-carboxymethylaminomethyluridine(34)-2'-O)-methyltransferase TrmL [Heliorestis acidaminivorans]
MFHIVLVEPEIPPNTGNIARLCAGSQSVLHLIEPLGFSIDDKQLKRAGLDYWHLLDVRVHESWSAFQKVHGGSKMYFLSTKGNKSYHQITYEEGDFFVFGKETKGLPDWMLEEHKENVIRIPLVASARSLNLSNAVSVVLYEALRQKDFPAMI